MTISVSPESPPSSDLVCLFDTFPDTVRVGRPPMTACMASLVLAGVEAGLGATPPRSDASVPRPRANHSRRLGGWVPLHLATLNWPVAAGHGHRHRDCCFW